MLINLNGNLINYNNVQSVKATAVHVDFLEQQVKCPEKEHEWFEVTVMPKIDFKVTFIDEYKRIKEEHFHIEGCPKPDYRRNRPGDSWIGFKNGKVPMPSVGYDKTTGKFHWNAHFERKSWQTYQHNPYNERDSRHFDISAEELKDFKTAVWAKVRDHVTLYLLQAMNEAGRTCRKAGIAV